MPRKSYFTGGSNVVKFEPPDINNSIHEHSGVRVDPVSIQYIHVHPSDKNFRVEALSHQKDKQLLLDRV